MSDTTPNLLDRPRAGHVGKPHDRIDGRLKVTGQATYAYEDAPDGTLYAHMIHTTIGAGRVTSIDTAEAEAAPGVVAVIVDHPLLPTERADGDEDMPDEGRHVLYFGQVLGAVVADSFENARAAAALVGIEYAPTQGAHDPEAVDEIEHEPEGALIEDVDIGDVDAAMRDAEVTVDVTYTTPFHLPASMEPHAALAWWEGDKLTVRGALQTLGDARNSLSKTLKIDKSNIRILAPYVGGGFGGKLGAGIECAVAAIAAKETGKPVKLMLSRRQTATMVHHRSDTRQHMRIAASKDGRITAIAQESIVSQNKNKDMIEPVAMGSIPLYAGKNRRFTQSVVRVNLPPAGSVRAPGEAVGTFGLEVGMDELAEKLGIDPIELRRINEPDRDPSDDKPFSQRRLVECYDEGAKRFGWDKRNPTPGKTRDGDWLIGHGMAASLRLNFTTQASARVTLKPDGRALVECDMTDIGTGTYTILAQMAADLLGLAVEDVTVTLGDTDLPRTSGSGGSWGASSSSSAVALACDDLIQQLARRMNASPDELGLVDGHVEADGRRVALIELLDGKPLEAKGHAKPSDEGEKHSQASHGAHFVEVAVNATTGEVRVRRMLGVFEAGRILNPKTARSQLIGGMVWGMGYALFEDAVVDARTGQFVNPDLAEYHVAAHADVPAIEVHLLDSPDEVSNEVGVKGIGELGISGSGAAIVNAIYNATGIRVRDFPVTLDKLLAGLPDAP